MKTHAVTSALITLCISQQALADSFDDRSRGIGSISYHSSSDNDISQFNITGEEEGSGSSAVRAGLSYYKSEDGFKYFGLDLGVRSNLAWRVSPFVGAGTFIELFSDDLDNLLSLYTIYPEAGIHLWLTESVRLTASSRYHISSWGRDSDRQLNGVELTFNIK